MIIQNNHYICSIPSKLKTMNYRLFYLIAVSAIASLSTGCKKSGSKSGGYATDKGQLIGVVPSSKWSLPKPPGMVYIPPGTFHMGSSDEDMSYALTARNKSVSISGFWMDATEITNNEYRQFTNWVRDSIGAKLMSYVKQGTDGNEYIDWQKARTIKWGDKATMEKIDAIIVTPDNRLFGKKELDANKIVYQSETFDYKAAANNKDATVPRSKFIIKSAVPVYPDSLCWVRDFAYSYNEPMSKKYFSHPDLEFGFGHLIIHDRCYRIGQFKLTKREWGSIHFFIHKTQFHISRSDCPEVAKLHTEIKGPFRIP